jgi:ATP adenylyltransferase
MERLWTPWRLAYVTGAVGGTSDHCIFCDAGPDSSRDELVLVRTPLSYVVLNLYPYNNGHLMVVPNRHVGTLRAMTREELDALMRLTRNAETALAEAYKP